MENLSKEIVVRKLSEADAAHAINAAGVVDPLGINSTGDITRHGHCFEFECDGEKCSFVVRTVGDLLIIDAAAASGTARATHVGLALAENIAKATGCTRIAFETERPGLVKLAQLAGFKTKSVLMEKHV